MSTHLENPDRLCTGECKSLKAESDFGSNKSKGRLNGRDDMCRPCRSLYNAAYYQRTKGVYNPSRADRRMRAKRESQEYIASYLRNHPCVDCGEADIVVLDFDHLRDKVANISTMISSGLPGPKLLAEIEKCEVVCSNDHRRRTARRGGSYRLAGVGAASSTVELRTFNA